MSRRAFDALLFLFGLGLFALLPRHASAATYYVATNGSDVPGGGTSGSPWATISYAVQQVPDGSLVLVRAGTYNGLVTLARTFSQGITVRSETPYQARLRHTATVVKCFYGQGIALEGFDIAHAGAGAGALVIQIQDLIAGPDFVRRITLRNNVLHDSFNNDILKINNGAGDVLVEGNLFYNQAGSDEHIDINSVTNVTVQDNVFMNDFAGSGRVSDASTSSFVVIKDSNGSDDGLTGADSVTVRRNVFLHYEGSSGQGFVRAGEDAAPFYEARNVLIENNLLLGDNTLQIRSPFQCMGVQNVVIRANTVAGNLPAKEYGCRIFTVAPNPDNDGIHLHNNIWSDPTGTMGDTFNRGDHTTGLTFDNNLFWNAGNPFPTSGESIVEVASDAHRVIGDPLLGSQSGLVLPRWNPASGQFADGSTTIRQAFERLVTNYGTPAPGSPALDAADPAWSPSEDILGNPRAPLSADIGAVEALPPVSVADPAARAPLLSVHPNPFQPSTTFDVTIRSAEATLRVHGVDGRLVRTFAIRGAGRHTLEWNGRDHSGRPVPIGLYYCTLEEPGGTTTRRVVRLR